MKKLSVGDKAAEFGLKDGNEEVRKLADFLGKWVVLYFYPKDMTPGCTLEAIQFSGLQKEFTKNKAVILGISKDSCESHRKFVEKKDLSIILLSDPEAEVQKLYGVWRPKKFMGREFLGTVRSTFLIDPRGKIVKIWDNVKANGHAEEVLGELQSLL